MSPKQEKAIVLFFQGKTNKEIAKILKLSDQTISNWRQTPEWKIAIAQYQQERHEHFASIIYGPLVKAFRQSVEGLLTAIDRGEEKKIQALVNAIAKTSSIITAFEATSKIERDRQASLIQLELALAASQVPIPPKKRRRSPRKIHE